MKKGILIYALGHENYYNMAVVLAASIKANDTLPIALVSDREIQSAHVKLFDHLVAPIPESLMVGDRKEYIKSKLYMYDHSPFDETIFLDADQIMIADRKLSPVFQELTNIDITFSNTGLAAVSVWSDIAEVRTLYGDKPYWNFHSEFVYFKKGKPAKTYFAAAKKVYAANKIKSATRFANGTMADELAFQVAAMITGIYPHKENWIPNFWYQSHPSMATKYPYELEEFLTYSIGGKTTHARVKTNYNNLAKYYFAIHGLSNPYQVVDKISFLPERNQF